MKSLVFKLFLMGIGLFILTTCNRGEDAEPIPAPASTLKATAISAEQIDLTWNDNSDNESGFKIERAPGGTSNFSEIATVGAGVTNYKNTSLVANTDYSYRVRSYNETGASAYSNVVLCTTLETIPLPPSNLTASATSTTQINLSWKDNSTNESGFKIERASGGTGIYSEIAIVNSDVTSYENSALTASTSYSYRVLSYNAAGNSEYSNTATISTQAPTPSAPDNLTASSTSATQIDLRWSDNSNDEQGFRIERAPGGTSDFVEIGSVAADVVGYQSTGLTPNTSYSYRVRSFNAVGNSAYSIIATATTKETIPAAPTTLSATSISTTQINLSWTDNSNNEQGFKIERAIGGTSFVEIAVVGAGITSFENTGLPYYSSVAYRVRAYNASGNSDYSNTASPPPGAIPAPPTSLAAIAVSVSQINLSWVDNSSNEQGFKIERAPGLASSFVEIASVEAGITTYQNTGLSANTIYVYRVRSYSSNGNSAYSNPASASTPPLLIAAPTNLKTTSATVSQINLSWTDNSNNEQGFKIERAPGGTTNFAEIGTVGTGVTTYQNTGLTANTNFAYRVRAYSGASNSAYSNIVNAATLPSTIVAPSNLIATAPSVSQINLSWTDNSNNEEGFKIERAPGGGTNFAEIATVAAGVTSYQNTGVTASTAYAYRVRAYNSAGNSAYSNTANVKTPGSSAPPSNLTAIDISTTQINLSWTDNSDNEQGFKIERAPGGTTNFVEIVVVRADVVTFQSTGLAPGTSYSYRVRSYNATGNSTYSNTATASTRMPLGAPGISSSTSTNGSITIQVTYQWPCTPSPFGCVASTSDGYQLEQSTTSSTSGFSVVHTSPGGTRTSPYNIPLTLTPGTYYFRARVNNNSMWGPYSIVIQVIVQSQPSTLTVYATEDNTLGISTTNANLANTVMNTGLLECGCDFAIGPYASDFVCGSIAIKFGTLQSQILGRNIVSAKLVLYVAALPADIGTTFAVNAFAASWNASSITHNNQPDHYTGAQVNFTPPITSVIPVELNITQIVKNWANGSFANHGLLIRDLVASLPTLSYLRMTGFESVEDNSGNTRKPKIVVDIQ